MARRKTISDDDLLIAARQVFVERGFSAPTREIGRRAGVSEGVLFQRYPTKRDLFFAAMVLPAADLTKRFRVRRSHGVGSLLAIARAMTDYFRSILPVLLPVISLPGFRFEEFAVRHPDSPLDALRRDLVAFLAAERKLGQIGPVDPGAAALMLIALAECIAFFERIGAHGGHLPAELLERAVRCLWDGMAPPSPAAGSRAQQVTRRLPHTR